MSCIREANVEPIPGYRLIEPLGSGGFGEVWKCEAPGGLHKAIKFVFGSLNSLDVDGARAEQEFKALDRIKEVRHPFVLSTERIEVIEGELLIVMELADKNLYDAFVESQSAGLIGIPRDDLLRFMRDAAEALDYMCEKHGLAHLDIKPRNLFLVSDRVKVADFGLVKHLERAGASGVLGGVTPLYAAPETFSNKISEHSDQYSLAIVYQELLTSQRPFNGKNARMLAQQHINEQPELRNLPEAERPVVARALSKSPADRFPSCLAFVRALYNARQPVRDNGAEGAGNQGRGKRPKTIADTMEDMLLEQAGQEEEAPRRKPARKPLPPDLEEVDLGRDVLAGLDEISELGLTAALPQTGTLRPTLVLGMGSLGRRALMELRCRFLDRFGAVNKLPLIRFLYLDSDREALIQAQRGAPEISFLANEVLHLPLQPMAHYRRRQLDQLSDWLPREKLFALPRNLQTGGSRALGRLAFADNYLRLVTRLKRELATAIHPDTLYQSVSNTGLALRDQTPRVVMIGAASGGASGYFIDLAYVLRRLLRQQRHEASGVNAFLLCGAPDDPATPANELANLYATLTEINHFSEGVAQFSAQYGADDPRLVEQGSPFDSVYLLTQRERTPEARHDVVAHLGQYLFQDLITPLGPKLEQERRAKPAQAWEGPAAAFRSFGTHAVWFPRGLLLRLAAREAVGQLVAQWTDEEGGDGEAWMSNRFAHQAPQATSEVEAAFARVLVEPDLQPASLSLRIEETAAKFLDGLSPTGALDHMLTVLEEQCWQYGGPDNPTAWSTQALARVRDWLGSGVQGNAGPLTVTVGLAQRKSRLNRALENACSLLAEEWDRRLFDAAGSLMNLPGPRLVSAEALLQRLVQHFVQVAQEQQTQIKDQAARAEQARVRMQEGLESCSSGGGFRWLTFRPQRPLRVFLDLLAAFARQCLAEDSASILQHFYHAVTARLRDRLRDLSLLRQRLRAMREMLVVPVGIDDEDWKEEDPIAAMIAPPADEHSPTPMASLTMFWEVSRISSTTHVVLPDNETELEKAASRFVATLSAEHWLCLDQTLQDDVLKPRGGLNQAAFAGGDLHRGLIGPLLDRAAACLSQYLPVTDVAQVELASAMGDSSRLAQHMIESLESAEPMACAARTPSKMLKPRRNGHVATKTAEVAETTFLLVPASESGKEYGEEARRALPQLMTVKVPGQADLMFCRERGHLTAEDLERILTPCREAYQQTANVPNASPHSRFDTRDWVPLES